MCETAVYALARPVENADVSRVRLQFDGTVNHVVLMSLRIRDTLFGGQAGT